MLPKLLLILGLCFSFHSAKGDPRLVFVQILWRHGDRAPISLYPTDPNPASLWVEGLGKLTMLGRKQHYALGKYFRRVYENFSSWSPYEVQVTSSDCDRCMKSAETNLASFFAPSSEWQFDPDLNWQPLSIYYISKAQDKYLEMDSYCPQADLEQKRVVDSPEGQEFISLHKKMFDILTAKSGSPITNWTAASYLHDTLYIERKYNLTVPEWAMDFWDELQNVADLSFYWSFNSPLLHRLRAGPFLEKTLDLMREKVAGALPELKFQIYSSHDTTISAVLDALNLYNMKQPPYCASLIFELYQEDNIPLLRLLYQNSTHPEREILDPHVLILDGCTEFCPLEKFASLTKNLIPNDWESECQLKKTFLENIEERSVTVGLFLVTMAVIILVMSIYSLWRLCKRSHQDNYAYTLMPID